MTWAVALTVYTVLLTLLIAVGIPIAAAMGLVGSGMGHYAMAIGMDTAQGKPGDALEYTAGAGGAARRRRGVGSEPSPSYGWSLCL